MGHAQGAERETAERANPHKTGGLACASEIMDDIGCQGASEGTIAQTWEPWLLGEAYITRR